MRSAVLLALALSIPAAEDPAAWLPEGQAEVRVPDLVRSRERWATTPYPALLLTTAWGQVTIGEVKTQLEAVAPGSCAALAGLRSVALSATDAGVRPRLGVAVNGDPVGLRLALAGLGVPAGDGEVAVGGGRLVLSGPIAAWVAPSDRPLAARPPPPAIAPAADLGLRFDLRKQAGPALPAEVQVAVSLDRAGLHEVVSVPASPAGAAFAQALSAWADPGELGSLPATTLAAVTWRADAAATTALLKAAGIAADGPVAAAVERPLARLGLPGGLDTIRALNGPCTAWMGEAVPFPTVNAALSLPEAVAKRWIAAATARLNLVAAGDGAQTGFLGLLQLTIGYADGRLVITTDPAGLEAWRGRKPGFAGHPEVRDAIAGMPARCLLIGAGRGGVSWAALAQLTVPIFAGMGNPQVVSLPKDLRAIGGRGWTQLSIAADGSAVLDSGGLFGGPFAITVLTGVAVPAVLWEQKLQQDALKPAPKPPTEDPPVF